MFVDEVRSGSQISQPDVKLTPIPDLDAE